MTVVSLYLFGGEVINGFAFALVVGIIIGTYSSIAIASPLLVIWNDSKGKKKELVWFRKSAASQIFVQNSREGRFENV